MTPWHICFGVLAKSRAHINITYAVLKLCVRAHTQWYIVSDASCLLGQTAASNKLSAPAHSTSGPYRLVGTTTANKYPVAQASWYLG